MRRIGVLVSGAEDDPEYQARLAAFRQGLERLGWSEGRNVRIDYRFARRQRGSGSGARERAGRPAARRDLREAPVAAALQRETRTIPIVFVGVSDPIGSGFVASLARPGGNITGLLLFEASITGKWLAMLKEIAPRLARAALVGNPKTSPTTTSCGRPRPLAPSLAIELVPSRVENAADIERTIESFARVPNGGLVLPPDATTIVHRDLIIALAARHRLPGGLPGPFFVAAGGLMSYGTDRVDQYRQAASYVDRILRGAKPGRPAGAGADQVRNGHQPQDREGARPDGAAGLAGGRRRGDRVRRCG